MQCLHRVYCTALILTNTYVTQLPNHKNTQLSLRGIYIVHKWQTDKFHVWLSVLQSCWSSAQMTRCPELVHWFSLEPHTCTYWHGIKSQTKSLSVFTPFAFPVSGKIIPKNVDCPVGKKQDAKSTANMTGRVEIKLFKWHVGSVDRQWMENLLRQYKGTLNMFWPNLSSFK